MRRSGTLVGLAAMAALVGALMVWDRGPSTDERAQARAHLVPGFDRERAQAITIARGAVTMKLERDAAGAWWLAAPRRRADDGKVAALVAELESSQVERRVAGGDRAQLGVDAPRAVITAGGAVLRLGGDAPDGHTVYVAREGEAAVLVVARRLADAVEGAPAAWVSTALTVDAPDAARAVGLGALALSRQASGAWTIDSPLRSRASAEKIAALLGALGRLRAARVLDEKPAGEKKSTAVELRLDGKLQAVLRAGDGCGGEVEVERADGARLCFDAGALAPAAPTAESLREPRLVPFAVDEIDRADVQAGARRLALERQDHGWRIVAPAAAAGPADEAAVREWLAALTRLRARAFIAPSGAPPSAELRLGGAAGEIEFAISKDGARRRNEDGAPQNNKIAESAVMVLDGAVGDLVDADPARFRPRRVVELAVDAVERVAVEEGGVVEEAARAAGGAWRLTRPLALDADELSVGRLVAALAALRAERFEPGAALRPTRRVTAAVRAPAGCADASRPCPGGGPITVELESGGGAGGCRARVAGAPPFRLAAETCADLEAHLATRRLVDAPGDRLVGLDLARGREHFSAERRGAGWVSGAAPVAAARIDALVEALRGLTAERVVGYDDRPWPAVATVRVRLDGAPEQLVELGADKGGHVPARLRGRPVRYSVAAASVDALFAAARAP